MWTGTFQHWQIVMLLDNDLSTSAPSLTSANARHPAKCSIEAASVSWLEATRSVSRTGQLYRAGQLALVQHAIHSMTMTLLLHQ